MFEAHWTIPAFAILVFGAAPLEWLVEARWLRAARALALLALFAAVYCLVAGLAVRRGWQDPTTNLDPAQVGAAARSLRARGGLYLIAASVWPWVLIVAGGLGTLGLALFCWLGPRPSDYK